jgi:hypothetical protein
VHGELEGTIVLGYSNKAHDGFLGHSYLGRWVNIGAQTANSNLKNNYGTIRVWTPAGVVDTGSIKLGCFLGDHVKTAIGTLLSTGTVVGAGSNLFGRELPPPFVPPFSWGSGADLGAYDVDRFLETASTAMGRRGIRLSDAMRQLLRRAWVRGLRCDARHHRAAAAAAAPLGRGRIGEGFGGYEVQGRTAFTGEGRGAGSLQAIMRTITATIRGMGVLARRCGIAVADRRTAACARLLEFEAVALPAERVFTLAPEIIPSPGTAQPTIGSRARHRTGCGWASPPIGQSDRGGAGHSRAATCLLEANHDDAMLWRAVSAVGSSRLPVTPPACLGQADRGTPCHLGGVMLAPW